ILSPLLKSSLTGTRFKVFDVAEDQRDKCSWFFAPAGPGDVDFPGASHPVPLQKSANGVADFPSTLKPCQLIKKIIVVGSEVSGEIIYDLRMGADHIGK